MVQKYVCKKNRIIQEAHPPFSVSDALPRHAIPLT